jgi:alkanesulfonate monooxygenase SsuD/methylene tetrahydromethanopterin reductase-like flavin-dependent oxidoreductase (luciferase family)
VLACWRGEDGAPPLPEPHPPLAVAAFGRKGLVQAARRGLPYLASPVETLAQLEENREVHRAHLPAGIRPTELVAPVMRVVHVTRDRAEAERIHRALEGELRAPRGPVPKALARAARARPEERVIVGTADEVAEQLAVYRARLGLDLLIARPQVPGADAEACHASLVRLAREVMPGLRRAA